MCLRWFHFECTDLSSCDFDEYCYSDSSPFICSDKCFGKLLPYWGVKNSDLIQELGYTPGRQLETTFTFSNSKPPQNNNNKQCSENKDSELSALNDLELKNMKCKYVEPECLELVHDDEIINKQRCGLYTLEWCTLSGY